VLAKFEIKRAGDGKFAFTLLAANNQVILVSQTYETKETVKGAIASVRENAPFSERYEERSSTSGRPYFVLRAANDQIIGTSQMYASKEAMHKGMASVRQNAPVAGIIDFSVPTQLPGAQRSQGSV
jgi:uncharacterized protein YegP (UPF0339 family)